MIKFFIKFFKALNSSQTPWQMSLALSFGMAIGLTPYSGIQTIMLIFLVLVINVHIGLFLISSTFFAGVAYLLDPYFEQLGYALLNMDAFKELFTAAYNSGFFRLTYFNNTIVLGSNIIAFILILPMFFILNRVVYIYRDKIAAKLQQYTIFKKLGISVSGKKDKLFRVLGVAAFALLGLFVTLFTILYLDTLIKNIIEENLTQSLKKKVSIENLTTSFSGGWIDIDGLYLADEKKALISMKNINIDIDFNQLLFHRYHIENINVSGMAFNTEVKKDFLYRGGSDVFSQTSAQKRDIKKENESSGKEFKFPSLSLENPKALIGRMGLSSLSGIDDTKEKINAINAKYKKIMENNFSKKEIANLKNEITDIQSKLKSKDMGAILQLKDDLGELNKKIEVKRELLGRVKKEFAEDKNSIKKAYKDLSKGAASDYSHLKSQYKFDADGGVNIVGVLFGEKVKEYLSSFAKYYKMAQPYLKSGDKKIAKPVPPRGEGRWVAFKYKIPTVDFLIQNTEISGVLQEQDFKSVVKYISSDPLILKTPMTFSFKSDGKRLKELDVIGKNEHINKHVKTTSSFSLSKGNVENIDMGFMSLSRANYGFNGELKLEDYLNLNSQVRVMFSKVALNLKQGESKLMKSFADVVKEIDDFSLDVNLNGTIETPDISVSSNLDKKLSGVFSRVFKNEVKKYQDELKILIDNQVNDKLKELNLEQGSLGEIENLLNNQTLGLESLQSSTGSMQERFKNGAEDKVKSLFKGF